MQGKSTIMRLARAFVTITPKSGGDDTVKLLSDDFGYRHIPQSVVI